MSGEELGEDGKLVVLKSRLPGRFLDYKTNN